MFVYIKSNYDKSRLEELLKLAVKIQENTDKPTICIESGVLLDSNYNEWITYLNQANVLIIIDDNDISPAGIERIAYFCGLIQNDPTRRFIYYSPQDSGIISTISPCLAYLIKQYGDYVVTEQELLNTLIRYSVIGFESVLSGIYAIDFPELHEVYIGSSSHIYQAIQTNPILTKAYQTKNCYHKLKILTRDPNESIDDYISYYSNILQYQSVINLDQQTITTIADSTKKKLIYVYDARTGKYLNEYPNVKAIVEALGGSQPHISQVLNKKRKTHMGYIFSYDKYEIYPKEKRE